MKAVQIVKPNDLRIVDMEKPGIDQEKNVLIKMTASGICGSDVGITAQMQQQHIHVLLDMKLLV